MLLRQESEKQCLAHQLYSTLVTKTSYLDWVEGCPALFSALSFLTAFLENKEKIFYRI